MIVETNTIPAAVLVLVLYSSPSTSVSATSSVETPAVMNYDGFFYRGKRRRGDWDWDWDWD